MNDNGIVVHGAAEVHDSFAMLKSAQCTTNSLAALSENRILLRAWRKCIGFAATVSFSP
jgi:hypothetical protein